MQKQKSIGAPMSVGSLADQIEAFGLEIASLEDESRACVDVDPAVPARPRQVVGRMRDQLRAAHDELATQLDQLAHANGLLEAERQRYKDLFDRGADPQFVTDRMGVLLDLNAAALALLGKGAAFVRGKPLSVYVARETMESYRNAITRVSSGQLVEARVRMKGSTPTPPRMRLRGWLTSNPHRVLWVATAETDPAVELRRAAATAAAAVSRASLAEGVDIGPDLSTEEEAGPPSDVERLLAAVSHEVRSPLHTILAWTSLLRRGRISLKERDRALDVIERNVMLQAGSLEGLLDVSRLATRGIEIERRRVDLAALVIFAADAVKPLALESGIDLNLDVDPGVEVHGDEMRLTQVAMNLLSNALKFTPPSGTIVVRLRRRGEQATLSVIDSGVGFEPDATGRIFECFVQETAGVKTKSGMGLGLFIAKKLVELHGGEVSAYSEGPDRGATFAVLLPVAREAPAA